jgi:hypothetical protein
VISASKITPCIPLLLIADNGSTMPTSVIKNVNLSIFMAAYYHGLASNIRGYEVALVWDLAFMAHIHPGALKNMFHFKFENLRIAIHARMYAVFLHETA